VNNFSRFFQYIIAVSAVFLAPMLIGTSFAANPYVETARELAEKILQSGRLENVAFSFQSRSSLEAKDISFARKALESELRARGVRFTGESQANARLQITISENLNQLVWVAEILQEQTSRVSIATQDRPQQAPRQETALQLSIQMKRIYEQRDPILDVNWQGDQLLALDPQKIALYRRKNESWELENSLPLNSTSPFLRDIRGRLTTNQNLSIQAYLPDLSCTGSISPPLILSCSQESRPWPIGIDGLSPTYQTNYFLAEGLPPFYSAAAVIDDGVDLLAVAGIDGQAYLFEKAARKVGSIDNWGDEIAAIDAGCGSRKQILASLARDPLDRGVIQAFELVHRKPVAVSSMVEFPGPITALWAIGQNAAIAVARNLITENYAAFHLSISCGR
jgi:hypothetical protein